MMRNNSDLSVAGAPSGASVLHNRLLTYPPALRRFFLLLALGIVCALYLADLTGMGMYGPDEPRYAAVGRAMAATGDLVTPLLWGRPWFEKPALLYWMTAAGFRLGLGPDLAPRLPVAILSLLFLAFFWRRLAMEWDRRAATYATAMLATSAGWLAYSHVAVTDLPLSVFFSAAVLLSLPWIARRDCAGLTPAAACLGLAMLAKGLVPIVLFLPVFAAGWKRLRDWLRPGPLLAFSICALPWYVLCTVRNGAEFIRVFFFEQQFGRFHSAALQHVQPWWFYFPALLVLLYPWFPLLFRPANFGKRFLLADCRVRILAAVVAFGFLFFSISVNKLYGYLLPLLPATFALFGIGLSRAKRPALSLIAPMILLASLPLLGEMTPRVLASHHLRLSAIPWGEFSLWVLAAAIAAAIFTKYAPRHLFACATALAGIGFLWFQFAAFPAFDAYASARPLWLREHPQCAPAASRNLLYGLYYYSEKEIPPCILDPHATPVVR